jgi:tRNA pseudouridine13 synthase
LRANRFRLRIRELGGDVGTLPATLQRIATHGVPNYFGPQRFGHDGVNLLNAWRLLHGETGRVGRARRSLWLSAARSLLFNRVLAARVERGTWERALPGDVMLLDGSRRYFVAEHIDAEIVSRLAALDIHPTAPLWGRGDPPCRGAAREFEAQLLQDFAPWRHGLERHGLKMERRACRARAGALHWEYSGGVLELRFELPRGSYATAVLREIIQLPLSNT